MAKQQFRGSTAEATAVILGAAFWEVGTKLTGAYLRSFPTRMSDGTEAECHQFLCLKPELIEVPLNDKGRLDYDRGKNTKVNKFAIGALTGIQMALQVAESGGFRHFQPRDIVTIECTGIQPADNGLSPMPEFSVEIER